MMIIEVRRMMIHEVMKETGLTRKAIEYYIDQGLIAPQTQTQFV